MFICSKCSLSRLSAFSLFAGCCVKKGTCMCYHADYITLRISLTDWMMRLQRTNDAWESEQYSIEKKIKRKGLKSSKSLKNTPGFTLNQQKDTSPNAFSKRLEIIYRGKGEKVEICKRIQRKQQKRKHIFPLPNCWLGMLSRFLSESELKRIWNKKKLFLGKDVETLENARRNFHVILEVGIEIPSNLVSL